LTITAHSASASALKAIEDAGGSVTLTKKVKAEAEA
jgi:ribosomal protein L15